MAQRMTASVSLILLVVLGWAVWQRVAEESDGAVVQLSNAVWHQDRLTVSYLLGSGTGLRAGDVVVAVILVRPGEFHYTVERAGNLIAVPVRLAPVSAPAALGAVGAGLLPVATLAAVGWLVFVRRRTDPAARVLLLVASLFALGTTTWLLGEPAWRLAARGPSPADLLGEVALAVVWSAVAHFAVIAPGTTLRVPPRVIAALYAAPLLLHGGYLAVVLPGSAGPLEAAGRIAQVSLLPSLVMPAVVAALMVLSYRRTPGPEARQRLRWVLVAFLSLLVAIPLWSVPMFGHRPHPSPALLPMAVLPSVVALAVAVLRFRLFDVEVIVRRGLVYGSLTVLVLAAYLSLGSLVGFLLGARPPVAAVLATGLVALGIQPARSWLRGRVGQLVYGDRDNPFGVVARLSRVDTAVEPQRALSAASEALARALRLAYVGIELRRAGRDTAVVAHFGVPVGAPQVVALHHGPDPVGRLLLGTGPRQEPFGPADRRLLDALTRQLGRAAAVVLLTAELREARRRLVIVRAEERRQTARTLHQGLESTLAAQGTELARITAVARTDPQRAAADLDLMAAATRTAIKEVRSLVVGLRPPALDQLGLVGAIRERAGPGAAVVGTCLGDLPAAVEVAAFWIAVEATAHARVAQPRATLTRSDLRLGDLVVEVRSDGGFRPGPGLSRAADRAAELGGILTVTATTLRASVPIRERT